MLVLHTKYIRLNVHFTRTFAVTLGTLQYGIVRYLVNLIVTANFFYWLDDCRRKIDESFIHQHVFS